MVLCKSAVGVTHAGDNMNTTVGPFMAVLHSRSPSGLFNTWLTITGVQKLSHLYPHAGLHASHLVEVLFHQCGNVTFISILPCILGSIKTLMVWVGGELSHRALPKGDVKACLLRCKDLIGHCDHCYCHGGLTQQHLQTQSYQLGVGYVFGKKEPSVVQGTEAFLRLVGASSALQKAHGF